MSDQPRSADLWAPLDPLDALVDINLPYPNLAGVPLMFAAPLDKQDTKAVTELWERGRAQTRLAEYSARMLGDVQPAYHHRVICDAIDELLADEYDELIINSPPGSAKSTYTSHMLGAFYLGKKPTHNVIIATHTADLSERWSRKVRNTISSSNHSMLFPTSSLSKDSTAVSRWSTSVGGELLAAGVGGSILGFRADLGIIDDPISGFEQAQSETQLAKVHSWYETDFVTRLKPHAKVVLICQRLSANDLAGYLIARNQLNPTRRQRVLILRMEAEDDDPLGRAIGERLWPEWYTPEMVEDAKRDDFKWRTLYQQRPPSETGAWVSNDDIQFVDIIPHNVKRYLCSDLALSVNKGDYSVHMICCVTESGDVIVEDAWRKRAAINETVERHLDMVSASPTPIMESLIDDDNASKVYMQLLAARARERGISIPWHPMPMRGQDKETRAAPLRGLFRRRRVFLKSGEWSRWLVNEILQFPNAMGDGVDDGVDALGLIGRRLMSLARPAGVEAEKPPVKTWQSATLNELWDDREHKRGMSARRI